MGKDSKISWTDHTFNPWWGCVKVSPGCKNCYAETLSKRTGVDCWGPSAARRVFADKHWAEPLRWNAAAEKAGVRRRVFCGSMCDWCEDHAMVNDLRPRIWQLWRETPWLDWLMLTKRPERLPVCLPGDWNFGLRNVWLGTSIESQEYLWRLSALVRVHAPVHFLSCEPLLGPIDFIDESVHGRFSGLELGIDWVIIGGESGPVHRQMDLGWALSIYEQCQEVDVPVWFKQVSGARSGMGEDALGQVVQELPRRVMTADH